MSTDVSQFSFSQKQELIAYLSTFVSPERLQRIESVLTERTRHVQVVVENIFQSHNASAIIRTCECFGVQEVHAIEGAYAFEANSDIVMGAQKWVGVKKYTRTDTLRSGSGQADKHPSTSLRARGPTRTCLMGLRQKGLRIAATTLRSGAIPIDQMDVQKPMALVLGTEETGLSEEAHELADVFVKLPLFGFTQSFNVSVSAALCLSQVIGKLRQSSVDWHLSENEVLDLRLEWLVKSMQRGEEIVKRWMKERKHEGSEPPRRGESV